MHVDVLSDVIRPLRDLNGFLLRQTGGAGDGRQEESEGRRRVREQHAREVIPV